MAERVARHGAASRSRLLDKHLAILAGPDAAAAFIDKANVRRAGGLPPRAAELFGAGIVNPIDDATLAARLRARAAALPADPSPRELLQAGELADFVREVKHLGLVIPMTAIGIAQRDFAVAGRRIPKGWLVT